MKCRNFRFYICYFKSALAFLRLCAGDACSCSLSCIHVPISQWLNSFNANGKFSYAHSYWLFPDFASFYTGHRLNTTVINYVHATSGVDCIMQCLLKNESCRSANFRKTDNCEGFENCELLKAVDSDEPENLKKDDNFDYYILLQPHRVSVVWYVTQSVSKSTGHSQLVKIVKCPMLLLHSVWSKLSGKKW